MATSLKILIVEENADMKKSISHVFEMSRSGKFELEFLPLKRAVGISAAGFKYDAAFLNFDPEPKSAILAAYRFRSIKPDLGIAVLAPSAGYRAPVEMIELGLGPLVVVDDEGISSLPTVALSLAQGGDDSAPDVMTKRELRLKHQELREITDSLARQSVHLIRLRNELGAEKNKIEALINGMTDGMVFFDAKGSLEVINPVAQNLFPSLTTEGFATFSDLQGILSDGTRNNTEDMPEDFETGIKDKTYRVRFTKVADASSDTKGSLFLFTDITQDKEYERLKDDFTNMISHELRTPLTSIRAAADNLLRGALGKVNDDQCKFLELIVRNVDRQQELIDNLLDLAKFEAGQTKVDLEKTNIAKIIALCVNQFSLAFKDKNVTLTFDPNSTITDIHADGGLVMQAVSNLLSNALKFTKKGGSVTVALKIKENSDLVYIEVADTGIGIPREHINSIFEKYAQADSGSSRRYAGTGLGLAICRQIAKAHGGDITVDSNPGEGSVFRLYLPIKQGN